MKTTLSRKAFLTLSSKYAAGAAAGAAGVSLLGAMTGEAAAAVPPWPWPYAKLDPEEIRKRGHRYYFDGGCGYGAFHAIVSGLRDAIGEPFTLVPTQMMYFGGGGAAGWGTLCGALNGSALAINLVVARAAANTLISELMGWYTDAQFPSAISNQYAQERRFYVNTNDQPLLQTICGSTLCHVSVTKWCTASGTVASAPARAERCARLTGDVAARAVELLNTFADGQFAATFVPPSAVAVCMTCHGPTGFGNVNATVKMNCAHCHTTGMAADHR